MRERKKQRNVQRENHPCNTNGLTHSYISENGPQLSVVTEQSKVVSRRGGNATLPCKFHRDASLPANPKLRIKWTKLTSDYLKEVCLHLNQCHKTIIKITFPYNTLLLIRVWSKIVHYVEYFVIFCTFI